VYRRPVVSLLTAVLLALVGVAIFVGYRRDARAGAPLGSLAVLPIRNLTGDPADEYLSDGITEGLISSLSRMRGLRVISRGSVFTFKDHDVDPRDIGRSLGVATILEGSVRRDGERLRVDVRLVNTADGRVLWAGEAADRPIRDIFAIQDETVREVAVHLQVDPGTADRQASTRHTDNIEAYQAYLKGRYFLNKRTEDGITTATQYFLRAIDLDPNYAAAYAGLADSYNKACWFLPGPPGDLVTKQARAAERALELDDSLPEAHTARSAAYAHEWDFAAMARESQRAVDLNPGDAEAHHQNAYCLLHTGRPAEAVSEIRLARELDPLNVVMNIDVGEILLYARRTDEAIAALNSAIEMDASRHNAHYDLGLAYELKGMQEAALEEYLKDELLSGRDSEVRAALRNSFATNGPSGYWKSILERREAESRASYVSPFQMAKIYARLGDKDAAFDRLEREYLDHSPTLLDLKTEPTFDPLRADGRYADLVKRVGL